MGDQSWADVSGVAVVCAEVDPKAMADTGKKGGSLNAVWDLCTLG